MFGPKILTEFCWMSMKPSFDLSCQCFLNIFVDEHGLVFSTVAELSDPCPDLINLKDLKRNIRCPSVPKWDQKSKSLWITNDEVLKLMQRLCKKLQYHSPTKRFRKQNRQEIETMLSYSSKQSKTNRIDPQQNFWSKHCSPRMHTTTPTYHTAPFPHTGGLGCDANHLLLVSCFSALDLFSDPHISP
jgi:hypothetical protein